MATYVPPKINTELIFYIGLPSQADGNVLQANPTIASGDFKVSIGGGAFNNLGTLPTVTPAAGKAVKITLSAAEVNDGNSVVVASDAAGAEWSDVLINTQTVLRQNDDLAFPLTSGRGILTNTTGGVDLGSILTTALTETAGLIAAAFSKFFNKATPTGTVNSIPDAVAGAAGGIAIVGSNMGTVSTVTGNVNGNVGGNVTGSVGSLATQAKADVNAEVLDVMNVDTYADPSGVPSFPASIITMLRRIFATQINPLSTTGTAKTLKNAGGTAQWKKVLADDGTTYTEGPGTTP